MKKAIPFIVLITMTLSLVSCLSSGNKGDEPIDSDDFNFQQALGLYEIEVPKNMKETNSLNEDASMQY